MNKIITLQENPEVMAWQKQFKKRIADEYGTDIKVRYEKKFKNSSKKGAFFEYGPDTHNLVITNTIWAEKIETRFTINFPFLITNHTVVDVRREENLKALFSLSLNYWLGIARLTGCKYMVWEDYNRSRRTYGENPPIPVEIEEYLNQSGFKKIEHSSDISGWVLNNSFNNDRCRYFVEFETNYEKYINQMIETVDAEFMSQLKKDNAAYQNARSWMEKKFHFEKSFYFEGYHSVFGMNFLEKGVQMIEREVGFDKIIQNVSDVKDAMVELFVMIREHNKLRNLITPPRDRFDMLLNSILPGNFHTLKPNPLLEEIYTFLICEYDYKEIEEWAAIAPSQNKYSYINENDVILFNYLGYIFVVKDNWYKSFRIEEKDKAYELFEEKYLEYYKPRAAQSLQYFKQRTGL